jgi:hypothetical protein
LLRRFAAGGGTLLDLEHLLDTDGRRVVAFGYWAGYVGAALAVLQHRGELTAPLVSSSREELSNRLAPGRRVDAATAVVIGAYGRSGRGACDTLGSAGRAGPLGASQPDPIIHPRLEIADSRTGHLDQGTAQSCNILRSAVNPWEGQLAQPGGQGRRCSGRHGFAQLSWLPTTV